MKRRRSRREFLRSAAAVGIIGPLVGGCGKRAEDVDPPETDARFASLGRDYLALGLTALAEAHKRRWSRGHHGAAVIASYYFCEENRLDERTVRALRQQVDAFVEFRKTEFPAIEPGEGTADPETIVAQLDQHIDQLRSGGHDVIYTSLGLRALRDLPDYATPAIVDGICRLLEVFTTTVPAEPETTYNREHPLPPYGSTKDIARVTLDALLRPWGHIEQAGAGNVVHWVTHADALITLEELGFGDVARRGHAAHQLYLNRRVDSDAGEEPERETIDWLSAAYWESDAPRVPQNGSWLFGHSFKLPYSLFRLLRRAGDPTTRDASLARASKLSIPFE